MNTDTNAITLQRQVNLVSPKCIRNILAFILHNIHYTKSLLPNHLYLSLHYTVYDEKYVLVYFTILLAQHTKSMYNVYT